VVPGGSRFWCSELVVQAGIGIQPLLGLAGRWLCLAFDLLPFAFQLLSGIPGSAANCITDSALDLLCSTLQAVFRPLGGQVLGHAGLGGRWGALGVMACSHGPAYFPEQRNFGAAPLTLRRVKATGVKRASWRGI